MFMEVETYFIVSDRKTIVKDPQASLDYSIDLTDWLAAVSDTLATATWTISPGLTKISETNTATVATVKVSGGVLNSTEWAKLHFETANARIDERTIYFQIKQR
jgi:hypothetical protein